MLSKIANNPLYLLLLQIFAFIIAFTSLLTIKIEAMGAGDFWVNQIIPIPYWICLVVLIIVTVSMIPRLNEKNYRVAFVFSSLLILVTVRMAFPTIFTTIPAYEPDTTRYMDVVNNWIGHGVYFGTPGAYQHDFPLSFLIAYSFIKLGLPIELFWRIAPFAIYILDGLLIYVIVNEISQKRENIAAISVFIFSLSSLGAWVSVHYCPDLVGSLFFLLSLYLSLRIAISGDWNFKNTILLLSSIVLLVLAHHLSTLYFIVTLLGLVLVAKFFKIRPFGRAVPLLLISVFTYTFWFAYGNLMYNQFFNLANYFGDYGGYTAQVSQGTPLFIYCEYLAFPFFVICLSIYGFISLLKIPSVRSFFGYFRLMKKPLSLINQVREKISDSLLIYNFGNILNIGVFFLGFVVSVIFNDRVLEILFIGFYPLASVTVLKCLGPKPSKKRILLIMLLFILIALVDVTRYYSAQQRRILLG
jgi:hypothetical protein